MLEFLLELLAQIFLEAAFEFVADLLGALVVRMFEWVFDRSEIATPVFAFLAYLCFGMVAGGLSVLLFPHRLIRPAGLPGLSLILSPTLAGLGMALIGSAQRKRNKRPTQIESFSYGFAFALGLALVRFFLVALAH
jgi:hypothetical protein